MVAHKDVVEAELHEQKGVSTASAGEIYYADGAGSSAPKPLWEIIEDYTVPSDVSDYTFEGLENFGVVNIQYNNLTTDVANFVGAQIGGSSLITSYVYRNYNTPDSVGVGTYNYFVCGHVGTTSTPFAQNYGNFRIYNCNEAKYKIVHAVWNNSDSTSSSTTANSGSQVCLVQSSVIMEKVFFSAPGDMHSGSRFIVTGLRTS